MAVMFFRRRRHRRAHAPAIHAASHVEELHGHAYGSVPLGRLSSANRVPTTLMRF